MMSAAVVVAAFTCASKLRRRRRLWVKRLYQRRLSHGCYPVLVRKLMLA